MIATFHSNQRYNKILRTKDHVFISIRITSIPIQHTRMTVLGVLHDVMKIRKITRTPLFTISKLERQNSGDTPYQLQSLHETALASIVCDLIEWKNP